MEDIQTLPEEAVELSQDELDAIVGGEPGPLPDLTKLI